MSTASFPTAIPTVSRCSLSRWTATDWARAAGRGQYEVEGSGDKKVTWHFAPSSDETHTFELIYQVHGAVRRENGQDVLVWNFLPTDYEYPIASANLKVGYPYEAKPVGPAEVRRGQAAVSEGPGLAVFTAKDIRQGSPLTVALRFPAGSLIAEPPEWQQHAAQVAQNAPTMWLLAALVLSVGTVFLARAWSVGRRQDRSLAEPRTMVRTAPPSDLSPALAGALVTTNAKATLVQAIATLFGLAQRGVVTFEQTGEKKWYRDAAVRCPAPAPRPGVGEPGPGRASARRRAVHIQRPGRDFPGETWRAVA